MSALVDPSTLRGTRAEVLKQLIDIRIDLERQIAVVLGFHNSFIPIAILPDEILTAIFSIRMLDDKFELPPTSRRDGSRAMRIVSQVCHRWREVALATPKLWTNIDFDHTFGEWKKELLRRTKNTPLDVDIWFDDDEGCDDHASTLEHIGHFASLQAYVSPDKNGRVTGYSLLAALKNPTPLLKSLRISVEPVTPPIRLPKQLFKEPMLNFRELSLINCYVSLSKPSLTGLTKLHVKFPMRLQDGKELYPSVPAWLKIINTMTSLQHLNIDGAFSPIPSNSRGLTVIHLPKLTHFRIVGEVAQCTSFIRHLNIANSCNVDLTLVGIKASDHDAIRRITRKVVERLPSEMISAWRVRSHQASFLVQNLFTSDPNLRIEQREALSSQWGVKIHFDWDSVADINANLPLLSVFAERATVLQFKDTVGRHHDRRNTLIPRLLGLFSCVKHLTDISLDTLRHLTELRDMSTNPLPLPSLHSVRVVGYLMNATQCGFLIAFLRMRERQGLRIEKLDVRNCGFNNKVLRALEQFDGLAVTSDRSTDEPLEFDVRPSETYGAVEVVREYPDGESHDDDSHNEGDEYESSDSWNLGF
ncbi:hypothetical protein K443DRAFT_675264 [Laccaria amethystina LaAM-08-1]|jgi:hypothetical protein|uniref:F-box domain-containing protein n=1 Tax=Laccaria amethystina LaAM-08-1 TaxID=1095629 RepID=A0A0C9YB43_9AGAR|nr:hypothetical protein K443DRAFT_675264 [Laccaria amethystina LaAM-08-1]